MLPVLLGLRVIDFSPARLLCRILLVTLLQLLLIGEAARRSGYVLLLRLTIRLPVAEHCLTALRRSGKLGIERLGILRGLLELPILLRGWLLLGLHLLLRERLSREGELRHLCRLERAEREVVCAGQMGREEAQLQMMMLSRLDSPSKLEKSSVEGFT